MSIKIFADTADLPTMCRLAKDPRITGFTTNPTLMRRAGVQDYRLWAKAAVAALPDHTLSFEVLSDDLVEMEAQAREIASWGPNVYVKVPVMNSRGESTLKLVYRLSHFDIIKVNVTGLFKQKQFNAASEAVDFGAPSFLSVFAGRIADTGRDPIPYIRAAGRAAGRPRSDIPYCQVIWASARGVYDVYQAEAAGCDIITLPPDLIAKLDMRGRDLHELSLETVRQFRDDAIAAGYSLQTGVTA